MFSLVRFLCVVSLLTTIACDTACCQVQLAPQIKKRLQAFEQFLENDQRNVESFSNEHCHQDNREAIVQSLEKFLPKIKHIGGVGIAMTGEGAGRFELNLDEGSTMVVEFEIMTEEPFQFTKIRQQPVKPGAREVPAFDWENLHEQIDAQIKDWFSGVIVVIRDGKPVFQKAYGFADKDRKIKNTVDTVFAIGSAPIDFTWVAILLLNDRGKLDLDDKVSQYFPNAPEEKRDITINQLMTGKSGLPDFHDRPQDKNKDHTYIDRDEAVKRILESELLFKPGTRSQHSHSAWGLLAAIVEITSGKSYQQFTRDELFKPLEMNDTGFFGDEVEADRIAVGYGFMKSSEPNSPNHWGQTSWLVMGSGGQISTIPDMIRWKMGLANGKLLSEKSRKNYLASKDALASDGDMFGFEFMHSRNPEAMFLIISNAVDSRMTRQKFDRLGRGLNNLIRKQSANSGFKLGVSMSVSQEEGTVVQSIVAGSAAEKAGIKIGDVLISANGKPLGSDPMSVLGAMLQKGEKIEFEIERDGQKLKLDVLPTRN
jgi:CubicO group peptidase (beta-lactamase class C family)